MQRRAQGDDARLPIKLGPTSNGEYWPVQSSSKLEHAREEALRQADANARALGIDRRTFLQSASGAATVLLCLNQLVACGGGRYAVPKEAARDRPLADAALKKPRHEFVFDVQTHFVSAERNWWDVKPPNMAQFLNESPHAKCGSTFPLTCFDRDHYLKELFLDSDTDMAVLSALWGTPDMNPLLPEEAVQAKERFEKMNGAPRLILHGVVYGKAHSPSQNVEHMQRLVERFGIRAFKLYPVWSPDGRGYRLDDPETGLRLFEQGMTSGVSVFAIHKGLKLVGAPNAFTSAIDVGPAAKAFPDAKLLIYHSGYDSDHKEGPYDPKNDVGIDTLIRSVEEHGIGKNGNVWAELGGVWREVMRDPDQAAHVIGKLLVHLSEDRILWGTDGIWYGSPQDQIQAFRTFEISAEYQERFGYPALTQSIKRKIFGLNAAAVYGVSIDEIKKAQRFDPIAMARREYQNDPRPSHQAYGPRTRRELLRLLALERAGG
jgi:predicted TIM-barrel fold metal-dependent hydrolase